ncbi:Probable peptide transporter ptr2 [Geodia barretti]|uniref:Probable peptide transporter ptr2 n=1 Tax=Geodia barretti TaxID=519541 RepID=A0AA35XJN7_GEOBA|nr:Probable peptide transporter ptr2 [Geodia barretti]
MLGPDIMPSVNDVLCILIIPLLDYLIYPHIESSMRVKLRPIHKLVAGMLFAAFSFLMSGLLQLYIHLPPGREHCHGDVSLAWQLPQLVLISFAEILVSVTGLELAYSQAPPDLRNLVTALWYIAQAMGVLLNAAVVQIPISLVYQFFLYFVLMLLVTGLFMAINCRTNCHRGGGGGHLLALTTTDKTVHPSKTILNVNNCDYHIYRQIIFFQVEHMYMILTCSTSSDIVQIVA